LAALTYESASCTTFRAIGPALFLFAHALAWDLLDAPAPVLNEARATAAIVAPIPARLSTWFPSLEAMHIADMVTRVGAVKVGPKVTNQSGAAKHGRFLVGPVGGTSGLAEQVRPRRMERANHNSVTSPGVDPMRVHTPLDSEQEHRGDHLVVLSHVRPRGRRSGGSPVKPRASESRVLSVLYVIVGPVRT